MEQLEALLADSVKLLLPSKSLPYDWILGIICPIYKKGDMFNCNNYSGITMFNTAYKIFSMIFQDHLVTHFEEIVGNYQRGFRNVKSTRS